MQQSYMYSDNSPPCVLWHYFMTPTNISECAFHHAFSPTNPMTVQPMVYFQEHHIDKASHHFQQENHSKYPQYQQQRLGDKPSHFDHGIIANKVFKRGRKFPEKSETLRTDSNASDGTNSVRVAPSNSSSLYKCSSLPSTKKGSAFTIDAILLKDDNLKSHRKNPEQSLDAISTGRTVNCNSVSTQPQNILTFSPTNGQMSIPLPLMHSTPSSSDLSKTGDPSRFWEVSPPYFLSRTDNEDHHRSHSLSEFSQMLPSTQLAPSSSSLSSSTGSSSTATLNSTLSESPCTPRNAKVPRKSGRKSKRVRTIFTPEQLERLEAEFDRQQYMVGTERYYLAASLNLTEAQVKVWFQNRRIKWRKQHLEQQQARLAQSDLYKNFDESDNSDMDDEEVNDISRITVARSLPQDSG